jgi:hypothetical protein
MNKIYYTIILVFLLSSCKPGLYKYKQFEITYEDGTTEIFIEKHWCYHDGSFEKIKIDDAGCIKITGQYICGVKRIKY